MCDGNTGIRFWRSSPSNGDWIRSMSDEELDVFLTNLFVSSVKRYGDARVALYRGELKEWLGRKHD